jgi:molecular chaperone DnaK
VSDTVYGIDLGTTYSAIARINEFDHAEIINNLDGLPTTPSVVLFEDERNVVVGGVAKAAELVKPGDVSSLIKRRMGTRYEEEFHGNVHTPESISALILKELVSMANAELGLDVKDVVITVPAYFGTQERESTRQAGQIAGLVVRGIVTEPVAAALSLGIRGVEPETLLVYDLGGGTFDTTVMKLAPGTVDVLVIDGNRTLGGADWDSAMVELIIERFSERTGVSPTDLKLDQGVMVDLRSEAEDAKKALTKKMSMTVRCRFEGHDEQILVTRAEFEAATAHLVTQTLDIAQRAVEAAQAKDPGLTIDKVLLVGGSAKMPMIDAALRGRLGWDPVPSDFDTAVAKGAAVYGASGGPEPEPGPGPGNEVLPPLEPKHFLGGATTLTVNNVLSRGIGVRFVRADSDEQYISFLVHANDSLPANPPTLAAQTATHNATSVTIALYEQSGERESDVPADNTKLEEKDLEIPTLPKGSPIDITVSVTAEGLTRVMAYDPAGGKSVDLEVTVSVLSDDDVDKAKTLVSQMISKS